ncbi:hypothetical protein SOVF_091130, partial [Spinacia oleracea]
PCGPYDMCVGFGFDELTNDYKVVRLVYLDADCGPNQLPPLVEIYSVSSGLWRTISASPPMYYIRHMFGYYRDENCYSQCYLNGCVHWPGFIVQPTKGMRCLEEVWRVIVTFNVQDEFFGELKFPACIEGSDTKSNKLRVTTCCDMLALIVMPDNECEFSIWVMKEYGSEDSWTKSFRFSKAAYYPVPWALCFRKNENFLMFASRCCYYWRSESVLGVLSTDCDNTDKNEVLEAFEGKLQGFYLGSYNEGLALFNEGKSISDDEVKDEVRVDDEVKDEVRVDNEVKDEVRVDDEVKDEVRVDDELKAGGDMSRNLPCECDIY